MARKQSFSQEEYYYVLSAIKWCIGMFDLPTKETDLPALIEKNPRVERFNFYPILDFLKTEGLVREYLESDEWKVVDERIKEARAGGAMFNRILEEPELFWDAAVWVNQGFEKKAAKILSDLKAALFREEPEEGRKDNLVYCDNHGFHFFGVYEPAYCPKKGKYPEKLVEFLLDMKKHTADEIIKETEYQQGVKDLSAAIGEINDTFCNKFKDSLVYKLIQHNNKGYYLNTDNYDIADRRGNSRC